MKKCWKCGREWTQSRIPPFKETCERCLSYLHSCKNCKYYDPNAAQSCTNRSAEYVNDKEDSNFCEEFLFLELGAEQSHPSVERSKEAKTRFMKLFGDKEEDHEKEDAIKEKFKKLLE